MQCSKPVHGYVKYGGGFTTKIKDANMGQLLTLPCGQCIQCRINRQEEWAIRCVHESKEHPEHTNHFVTLTYDEKSIPSNYGLDKDHIQKFLRSLRDRGNKNIRFYATGEYGDKGLRPHYHAIIFNLQLEDLQPLRRNKRGEWLYRSVNLENSWHKGECPIGSLTWQSVKYAAKYTHKILKPNKLEPQRYIDNYQRTDGKRIWQVPPEFQMQSQRLGHSHLEKYYKDYYPHDYCIIEGKKKRVPAYYDYALKKIDEALHQEIMAKRRQQAEDNYSYPDQKMIEEKNDYQAKVLNFKLDQSQQHKRQGIQL